VRIHERNSPADTKVSAEGGGGGAPGTGAEISLQPMEKTVGEAGCPLQPMAVHGAAEIHLQPGEDPTREQGHAQMQLCPHGEPVLEQAPGRTCGSVGNSRCSNS